MEMIGLLFWSAPLPSLRRSFQTVSAIVCLPLPFVFTPPPSRTPLLLPPTNLFFPAQQNSLNLSCECTVCPSPSVAPLACFFFPPFFYLPIFSSSTLCLSCLISSASEWGDPHWHGLPIWASLSHRERLRLISSFKDFSPLIFLPGRVRSLFRLPFFLVFPAFIFLLLVPLWWVTCELLCSLCSVFITVLGLLMKYTNKCAAQLRCFPVSVFFVPSACELNAKLGENTIEPSHCFAGLVYITAYASKVCAFISYRCLCVLGNARSDQGLLENVKLKKRVKGWNALLSPGVSL